MPSISLKSSLPLIVGMLFGCSGFDGSAGLEDTAASPIFNGTPATEQEHVRVDNCSGTMLTNEWVLTAGHCAGGRNYYAGTLSSLDAHSINRPYSLPAGYPSGMILETATIRSSSGLSTDSYYLYLSDGTYAELLFPYGFSAPPTATWSLPGGRPPTDLVGLSSVKTIQGIYYHAWLNDGKYFWSSSPNLSSPSSLFTYSGATPSSIRAIACDDNLSVTTCTAYLSGGTWVRGIPSNLASSASGTYTTTPEVGSNDYVVAADYASGTTVRTYYSVVQKTSKGKTPVAGSAVTDLDSVREGVVPSLCSAPALGCRMRREDARS